MDVKHQEAAQGLTDSGLRRHGGGEVYIYVYNIYRMIQIVDDDRCVLLRLVAEEDREMEVGAT